MPVVRRFNQFRCFVGKLQNTLIAAPVASVQISQPSREIGSNFWASEVRPTLRKRLEESPRRVLVIIFIGTSIAPQAPKQDHA